jgi:Zn-dependent protease
MKHWLEEMFYGFFRISGRASRYLCKSLTLFHIRGYPVVMHWSFIWFYIYLLLFSPNTLLWTLIFTLVFIHELGHAFVAQYYQQEVVSITFYPLGGAADIKGLENAQPKLEMIISFAGPFVNILSGLLLFAIVKPLVMFGLLPEPLIRAFSAAILLSVVLGVLNLFPIFPLDGGRILRSFLAFFFEYENATIAAARLGQLISAGLFVFTGLDILTKSILLACIFFSQAEIWRVHFKLHPEELQRERNADGKPPDENSVQNKVEIAQDWDYVHTLF